MIYRDDDAGVSVRTGFKPGDLGCITYLHGTIYDVEYNLDTTFESYVAGPLSEFGLSQSNPRQQIWIVEKGSVVHGGVAIVEHSKEAAQLRWLILTEETRGLGLGRRLVEYALEFCREQGYSSVFLWTFSELHAAAHLYLSHGFRLTEEKTHIIWGREITEQRYDLDL
ncbi:GNAT family N-acetyltransferase [Candidatus Bathyarchaeota archaeon]|nr:GNAT family N-acetyltransferase [Candidatus Bathyarchaeota archaeon]